MSGRTQKSIKNMLVMLSMQILSVLVSFACRTVFAKLLAAEYLGLSGLFTNIISVLALSELGIGSVIIIHLYKPLAEKDETRIRVLMGFYRKAYTVIGLFIIACGLILTPFLDYLVKTDTQIPYLKLYFLLFIVQSASSYFFSYKQSLLTASQQEYICSAIRQIFGIVVKLLQILALLLTRQYIVYLLVSIAVSFLSNIVLSHIADKKFPFLKQKTAEKLDKAQMNGLFKNVGSMMLHKVGHTVISSTDNILISSMIGVIYTGLYSNYLLIVNSVTQIINIAFTAVSASVGDFNAQQSPAQKKKLFDAMQTLSYILFGVCAICFFCLFQPTISLWLGEDFLLDSVTVLLICINFYIGGIVRVPSTFSDVNGLYTKTKRKPILMATINLVTSIICLQFWGLAGVFVGTLVSYLAVGLWIDPCVVYRDVFSLPVSRYFLSLAGNTLLIAAVGAVTYIAVSFTPYYILKVLVCGALSCGLLLLCYCRTPGFSFIFTRVKGALPHKKQ